MDCYTCPASRSDLRFRATKVRFLLTQYIDRLYFESCSLCSVNKASRCMEKFHCRNKSRSFAKVQH